MNIKNLQGKLNKALANKDLSYVIKGSAFTVISMLVVIGLRMCGGVIIGRFYGPSIHGELRLLTVLVSIVVVLGNFGLKDAMLRLIPEFKEKENLRAAWNIYIKGLQYLLFFALLGSFVILCIAPWFARFNNVVEIQSILTLSAAFVFFIMVTEYNIFSLRAIFKIRNANYITMIRPAVRLAALIFAVSFFFYEKRAPLYIYLFVFGIVGALTSCFFIYKHFYLPSRSFKSDTTISRNDLLQLSFPMLLTYASFLINDKADSLMIQRITQDSAQLGIYGVCLTLANLGRMGMQAMNVTIQPKLSQMFHGNRVHEIENITQKTSKTFALLNIPVTLVLVFGGSYLLSIYGIAYKVGAPALAILAVGQMVNTFAGPTAQLLNVSGHQKYFMKIAFLGAIVNIIFNVFLIPKYGILGAAIASAISMITWNLIASIFIKRKFGFFVGYVPILSELRNNKK